MTTLHSLFQATVKTDAEVGVQVSRALLKETKAGKPYYQVTISDHSHSSDVKFWNDSQAYSEVLANAQGGFYFLKGTYLKDEYGLNVSGAALRGMNRDERDVFMAGGGEAADAATRDWGDVYSTISEMEVEPLKIVLLEILDDPKNQEKYRRAAGALKNHHNRRGGLLAHTASMLRAAKALVGAKIYTDICPDLLYAGLIMHDYGKVHENDTGDGFAAVPSAVGEMLGHISIATGVVARYWRLASDKHPDVFKGQNDIFTHLQHLILSHHGQKDFGSPVTPKTPEAWLLHSIDIMDAKMEMVRVAYANHSPNAQGLVEAGYPLKTTLITPLCRQLAEVEPKAAVY